MSSSPFVLVLVLVLGLCFFWGYFLRRFYYDAERLRRRSSGGGGEGEAAERAGGVGGEPVVDAVHVEGVPACRDLLEFVVGLVLRKTYRASVTRKIVYDRIKARLNIFFDNRGCLNQFTCTSTNSTRHWND